VEAPNYWEQGTEQMRECVRGREGAALLMAAVAGAGVGFVVGALIGRTHREEQSWRRRMMAEGFGKRLMERFEGMIPEAIAEHFAR
jgi:hypothetical protein